MSPDRNVHKFYSTEDMNYSPCGATAAWKFAAAAVTVELQFGPANEWQTRNLPCSAGASGQDCIRIDRQYRCKVPHFGAS
jgi:hypothetical protein